MGSTSQWQRREELKASQQLARCKDTTNSNFPEAQLRMASHQNLEMNLPARTAPLISLSKYKKAWSLQKRNTTSLQSSVPFDENLTAWTWDSGNQWETERGGTCWCFCSMKLTPASNEDKHYLITSSGEDDQCLGYRHHRPSTHMLYNNSIRHQNFSLWITYTKFRSRTHLGLTWILDVVLFPFCSCQQTQMKIVEFKKAQWPQHARLSKFTQQMGTALARESNWNAEWPDFSSSSRLVLYSLTGRRRGQEKSCEASRADCEEKTTYTNCQTLWLDIPLRMVMEKRSLMNQT